MRAMLRHWLWPLLLGIAAAGPAPVGAQSSCNGSSRQLEIDLSRPEALPPPLPLPATLFGFNLPWLNFQDGYLDGEGKVRPEVLAWLAPFRGALLRYPGGTESNWFEWRKSVGAAAGRAPIRYDGARSDAARFGVDEFLQLSAILEAVPLFVLNLSGPYRRSWTDAELDTEVRAFADYLKSRLPPGQLTVCQGADRRCAAVVIELGNELDQPPFVWPSAEYTRRARVAAQAIREILPSAVVIAQLTSSPWGMDQQAMALLGVDYSSTVPRALGGLADAYAFHAYYDGITVPAMLRFLNRLAPTLAGQGRDNRLYVTEYGRWPNRSESGDWREQWHLAEDISGALSNGDFLLALMSRSEVRGAVLHALGTSGPWQGIRRSRQDGGLYPTAAYWGMLAIRAASLDQLLLDDVVSGDHPAYAKAYDLRYAVTATEDGSRTGVLAVNRSASPLWLRLRDDSGRLGAAAGVSYLVAAPGPGRQGNTDGDRAAITMISKTLTPVATTTRSLCVPGRAIATFVLTAAAPAASTSAARHVIARAVSEGSR